MFIIVLELLTVELRVVHLTKQVDELLEEVAALFIVLECEVLLADAENKLKHILLSVHWGDRVDCIECILLKDYEVNEL